MSKFIDKAANFHGGVSAKACGWAMLFCVVINFFIMFLFVFVFVFVSEFNTPQFPSWLREIPVFSQISCLYLMTPEPQNLRELNFQWAQLINTSILLVLLWFFVLFFVFNFKKLYNNYKKNINYKIKHGIIMAPISGGGLLLLYVLSRNYFCISQIKNSSSIFGIININSTNFYFFIIMIAAIVSGVIIFFTLIETGLAKLGRRR